MMVAMTAVCDHSNLRLAVSPIIDQLFDGPAETARSVGVYGFEDEQNGAEFEKDDGADEGGHAAAVVDFAVELGRGGYQGKPDEETLSNTSDRQAHTRMVDFLSASETYV